MGTYAAIIYVYVVYQKIKWSQNRFCGTPHVRRWGSGIAANNIYFLNLKWSQSIAPKTHELVVTMWSYSPAALRGRRGWDYRCCCRCRCRKRRRRSPAGTGKGAGPPPASSSGSHSSWGSSHWSHLYKVHGSPQVYVSQSIDDTNDSNNLNKLKS